MQDYIVIRCSIRELEQHLNAAVQQHRTHEVFRILTEQEYNGTFAHIVLKKKSEVFR